LLRNHCTIAFFVEFRVVLSHFIRFVHSLCDRFGIALQSHRSSYAITLQSHCNIASQLPLAVMPSIFCRFVITLQSPFNRFTIAL
jgi:hypothetical protein